MIISLKNDIRKKLNVNVSKCMLMGWVFEQLKELKMCIILQH